MSEEPLKIHRYITLATEESLDVEDIKKWFSCVNKHAPSGVVNTVSSVDNDGLPRAVKLIHREDKKGKHFYIIPLTRDLSAAEVEKIVEIFVLENPDLDFDIETNAEFTASLERPNIKNDHSKHISLCNALAKEKHDDWMKEKIQDEWRYGPEFSVENKTHPLILPWEQLPEEFKKIDLSLPDKLVSILNGQGFSVISKDTLENLVGLLKNAV